MTAKEAFSKIKKNKGNIDKCYELSDAFIFTYSSKESLYPLTKVSKKDGKVEYCLPIDIPIKEFFNKKPVTNFKEDV